jgi:hypothetical protein
LNTYEGNKKKKKNASFGLVSSRARQKKNFLVTGLWHGTLSKVHFFFLIGFFKLLGHKRFFLEHALFLGQQSNFSLARVELDGFLLGKEF